MRLRFVFEVRIVLIALALLAGGSKSVAQNRSVYTSLETKQCRTIKTETTDAGDYEGHCPGVAGYSLIAVEGDIISPGLKANEEARRAADDAINRRCLVKGDVIL